MKTRVQAIALQPLVGDGVADARVEANFCLDAATLSVATFSTQHAEADGRVLTALAIAGRCATRKEREGKNGGRRRELELHF